MQSTLRAVNKPCFTGTIPVILPIMFHAPLQYVYCVVMGLLGNRHSCKQKVFQMEAASWIIVSRTKYGLLIPHETKPLI